ncbi:MAG TPA: VOC family protein [Acidimicrobiales bacterium]|nr:VOC family protein [Acidimicrobiales bacterium]
MSDRFEELRRPAAVRDPDPRFAAALRASYDVELSRPRAVGRVEVAPVPSPARVVADRAASAVTAYLAVGDARAAIAWYGAAFGSRLAAEPIVMEDGHIGHAVLDIGGGRIYVSDESPEHHVAAPVPGAAATVSLVLEVGDVDEVLERALDLGAALERAPADQPHGRAAVIRDPFSHRWMLHGPARGSLRRGDRPNGG